MRENRSFLEDVFELLNAKTYYAVMRNYEGLPYRNYSRDIDILIEKKDLLNVLSEMRNVASNHNYKVLLGYKSAGQWALFFQSIEKHIIIQLDFLFCVFAKGTFLLSAEGILKDRIFNGYVYHLSDLHVWLCKELYNRLLGAEVAEKYREIKEKVLKADIFEVNTVLVKVFGKRINDYSLFTEYSSRKLRKMAFTYGMYKNPIRQIGFWIIYKSYCIVNMLHPQGFSIALSGADGCGKTSILQNIENVYRQVWNGSGIEIFHFRPCIIPRIAEIMYKIRCIDHIDTQYDLPHRGKASGFLGSLFRLAYYVMDYQLGYLIKTHTRSYKRYITFYDRYYADIIIDSERCNIKLPLQLLNIFGVLVPQPRFYFLVVAETEKILNRKKELTQNEIEIIQNRIEWLSQRGRKYYKIENNSSLEQVCDNIMRIILDKQDKKYAGWFR